MDPTATASSEQPAPPSAIEQAAAEGRKLKVLIGMDDSDESFYALQWALNNLLKPVANEQSNAPPLLAAAGDPSQDERCLLYLVHVQQPFQSYVYPAGPAVFATTTSVMESVRKAQAEIAESLFARAMKICKEHHVRSETLVLEGSPKEMICQAAEQMHVDMLVLGSRGLGQIKRAFLGSVSDYCAHHVGCPVLIVKPPKNSHRK
ncbi:hypothetical protein V2J09_018605 [Rumex salicifolius]